MSGSANDPWSVGDDVTTFRVPESVCSWLERAPAWPPVRLAREAWLTACVFALTRDDTTWWRCSEIIGDNEARESVASFLRMAGLIDPSTTDSTNLVHLIYLEMHRLLQPPTMVPVSISPRAPRLLEEWLDSPIEPDASDLTEALAKAMALSGKDPWNVGDDVMPPCVPSDVLAWLGLPPTWPAFRPAREAWLTACVFVLTRDAGAWCQRGEIIGDDWARECVSRFLLLAGLIDPSVGNAAKLIDDTLKELQRLPWPGTRLVASEDAMAGWVRGVLEFADSEYVATAEIFVVWQNQNPGEDTTLKEFGERLARIILAWQKAGAECGLVTPIKNISRSRCRDYPRNTRPRGWAGLALREGAIQIWKAALR
ncbi:MAG: hypothetical protein ABIT37_21010 [Luteolibacter sp.]